MADYPTRYIIVRETEYPDATGQEVVGELVWCKDCVHNRRPPEAGNADCELHYGMTDQLGFCHMGDRR